MKVGILTGGGDCPGLNAVLRAFVLRGVERHRFEVVGLLDGWKGLVHGRVRPLAPADVRDLVSVGGTVLGTSRTNPYKKPEDLERARAQWQALGLDALVAVGGEDTLGVANLLSEEGKRLVGVPKTIDNDLSATDYTFGFDSAVNVAMECVDRVRTTAASHHRTIVIEVMGRHAGWIAAHVGIAAGAHATLLPEYAPDVTAVCDTVRRRKESGAGYSLVVVAEGVELPQGAAAGEGKPLDAFGHVRLGGVGEDLAGRIEKATGAETRSVVLGHVQRGGSPSAFDRVLGSRFGFAAADLVRAGSFGHMVSLRGSAIVSVPLASAVAALKTVDAELHEVMQALSG
jgi:6-phosphofructokinase 1